MVTRSVGACGSKGACTKDVHPKGGFGVVDENGQGGRGGLSQMDVHF